MSGVNKVILVGNLGKDPEVNYIDPANPDLVVARFTLATSETFRDKSGEKRTNTEWHNIVVWRGLAKIAEQYLKKGSQVYLEGKLKYDQYQDKEGVTRYRTEIQVQNLTLLGRPGNADSGPQANPSQQAATPPAAKAPTPAAKTENPEEDDLPF